MSLYSNFMMNPVGGYGQASASAAAPQLPEETYESWTGQQMADWWAQQGKEGNWYDPYASTLNPEGAEDFDWSVYNASPVAQMKKVVGPQSVDAEAFFADNPNARSYYEMMAEQSGVPVEQVITQMMSQYNPEALEQYRTTPEATYELAKVYPEAYNLNQLRTQTPQDWMQSQGYEYRDLGQSEPYQGLQELVQSLVSPEGSAEMMGGARDYAAQAMGFGSGAEYQQTMRDLQSRLDSMDYSGRMTPEQEQALAYDIQTVRDESMKMLEAMRAEGRSSAALYKADEISGQIGNMAVQGRLKYMEANLARAQLETAAIQGRYDSLASQGIQAAGQYIGAAQQRATQALQGYATELTTLAQQNSEYLDQYKMHADQVYQSIMTDMGFEAHTMAMDQERWEASIAPLLQQFEMDMAQYELNMQQQGLDLQEQGLHQQMILGILNTLTGGLTSIFGG